MRYGLDVPTAGDYASPHRLADLAAEAEDAGWDGFFLLDVLFAGEQMDTPVVDPWIALAAVAMRTEHIRLGAMVTPLARRRPWQVARQAVAIDHLSGGRLVFGAGLGWRALDFTPFGEPYDPVVLAQKLEEALEVIDGLWSGRPVSLQGAHYQIECVTMRPGPLQSPRIPVWLAGGWPRRKPIRRAAAWDGLYLMTVNQTTGELLQPDEIREIVAYVARHRTATDPFDVALNGETPADPAAGAEIVEPYRDAGATWWVEYEASRGSFDDYRRRIRRGPPRL
jgi:alkanesulfonate monooxygenase SsuD/methylene tetrahydromethanopterin reductase-like flavin-dependent oxidoreductase (luciferase family)